MELNAGSGFDRNYIEHLIESWIANNLILMSNGERISIGYYKKNSTGETTFHEISSTRHVHVDNIRFGA